MTQHGQKTVTTPEGKVKAKVNRNIKRMIEDGYRIWKFMPVQTGMGAPALDFIVCINGWFVSLETKTDGKDLTDRQKVVAETICNAGGLVFRVDNKNIDKVFARLRRICVWRSLSQGPTGVSLSHQLQL